MPQGRRPTGMLAVMVRARGLGDDPGARAVGHVHWRALRPYRDPHGFVPAPSGIVCSTL